MGLVYLPTFMAHVGKYTICMDGMGYSPCLDDHLTSQLIWWWFLCSSWHKFTNYIVQCFFLVSFPPIATLCFHIAYLIHFYAGFVSSFGIPDIFRSKRTSLWTNLHREKKSLRNREWYRPFLALQGFSCTVRPWCFFFFAGGKGKITGWWFQIFFIFTPTWGRFPFWLKFLMGWKHQLDYHRLSLLGMPAPDVAGKGSGKRL